MVSAPRAEKSAHQPLQQPGAEGIEPLDTGHVDIDAFDAAIVPGRVIDLRFQQVRVLGNPSAAGSEPQPPAFGLFVEQRIAHALPLKSPAGSKIGVR